MNTKIEYSPSSYINDFDKSYYSSTHFLPICSTLSQENLSSTIESMSSDMLLLPHLTISSSSSLFGSSSTGLESLTDDATTLTKLEDTSLIEPSDFHEKPSYLVCNSHACEWQPKQQYNNVNQHNYLPTSLYNNSNNLNFSLTTQNISICHSNSSSKQDVSVGTDLSISRDLRCKKIFFYCYIFKNFKLKFN